MSDISNLISHIENPQEWVFELKRERCERSLLHFVREFWSVVEPSTELVEGKPLLAIIEHLEAVTKGNIQKLLINVPPGSMKSLLTNVFWPAHEWAKFPFLRYVTFSYASALTLRDNRKFLSIISSPKYQAWWGKKVQLTKKNEELVGNAATGWKLATSFGGVGTGERGDRVILDDPHNVKDAESELVRTSTTDWFTDAMSNRLNDMKTSTIVVIMQRVHADDVSGIILKRKLDYTHLMIPAEFEEGRVKPTKIGWKDWRTEEGESFWPERYPESVLDELKATINPHAYAGQYQQRPEPKGGGILKRDWWMPWLGTRYPDFSYVLASCDTAYTEKQENDPSAMVVLGVYKDDKKMTRVMLMDAWAERLPIHDLVQKIGLYAGPRQKLEDGTIKGWSCDKILIENKASGISVEQEMRRMFYNTNLDIELVDPKSLDKVARVHSISGLLFEGIVQYPAVAHPDDPDMPWKPRMFADKVIEECAKFPRDSHDDLVDCFSQGMRYLREIGILDRKSESDADEREEAINSYRPTSKRVYQV